MTFKKNNRGESQIVPKIIMKLVFGGSLTLVGKVSTAKAGPLNWYGTSFAPSLCPHLSYELCKDCLGRENS